MTLSRWPRLMCIFLELLVRTRVMQSSGDGHRKVVDLIKIMWAEDRGEGVIEAADLLVFFLERQFW